MLCPWAPDIQQQCYLLNICRHEYVGYTVNHLSMVHLVFTNMTRGGGFVWKRSIGAFLAIIE